MAAGSIEKIANFFKIPKSALFAEGNDRFLSYEKILRLPVVAHISCGYGSLAYGDIAGYEPTPEAWLNDGEYFYLRAAGESMKNARVQEGDLLLIHRQSDVDDGEIAAVLIDGETALKKVYKRGGITLLQSENADYAPIILDGSPNNIRIFGKLERTIITY